MIRSRSDNKITLINNVLCSGRSNLRSHLKWNNENHWNRSMEWRTERSSLIDELSKNIARQESLVTGYRKCPNNWLQQAILMRLVGSLMKFVSRISIWMNQIITQHKEQKRSIDITKQKKTTLSIKQTIRRWCASFLSTKGWVEGNWTWLLNQLLKWKECFVATKKEAEKGAAAAAAEAAKTKECCKSFANTTLRVNVQAAFKHLLQHHGRTTTAARRSNEAALVAPFRPTYSTSALIRQERTIKAKTSMGRWLLG